MLINKLQISVSLDMIKHYLFLYFQARTEITITPVVNTPVQSHSNSLIHVVRDTLRFVDIVQSHKLLYLTSSASPSRTMLKKNQL